MKGNRMKFVWTLVLLLTFGTVVFAEIPTAADAKKRADAAAMILIEKEIEGAIKAGWYSTNLRFLSSGPKFVKQVTSTLEKLGYKVTFHPTTLTEQSWLTVEWGFDK